MDNRDEVIDTTVKAMRTAWQLGQTYWRQADSEYVSDHKRSDKTQQEFDALVDETRAMLAAASKPPEQAEQHRALSDEQRKTIESAANCLDAAVTLTQDGYDGEPGPASSWDVHAQQLVYELRALLATLNGGNRE
jgi:predicted aminopeptidase